MDILIRIGLVLFFVFLNAYFVASEFSLVALRKTRINELVKKGSRNAKLLQSALNDLDNYISSTQLGITIASIALGWVGEPAVASIVEPFFTFLPENHALLTTHVVSVGIAFILITFLHIVLGELAPKTLALQRSEKVSLVIISPLVFFTRVFQPVIWILNAAGRLTLRALGLSEQGEQFTHSEEEIKMLLMQSSKSGAIPSKEVEMVYNVFQLGDIPAKAVMIPRTDVVSFNVATSLREVIKKAEQNPHSRFPVFETSIDNVIGFIHIKDVYRELMKQGEQIKLSQINITREILYVPEVKKIDGVLSEMRRKRVHLAVVNDEFGGTAGIITIEDIIESVIGEIEDEFDQPFQEIARQKDGSYLILGHTTIDEIRTRFNLPLKGQGYTTIGGLVFGLLGHEPRVGDSVQISNLKFEVKKIEGKRIKLLKMRREAKSTKK